MVAFDEVGLPRGIRPFVALHDNEDQGISQDAQVFSPSDLEDARLREDGGPEHAQLFAVERDTARALLRRAALRHTPLEEQQAFREGSVDDGSIRMAAELASIYGDARYAIELIYRAGKLAEVADSAKVLPEHVRRAKASLPPQFRKEELVYLDKHQRVMLMAISGMLQKSDSAFADHRGGGEELRRPLRVDGPSPEPPHPGLERHQRAREEGDNRDGSSPARGSEGGPR